MKTVVFYFQRRIEGRRSVVPIPVRSTSSLIHGSTKKQTQACLLLLSRLEIEGRLSSSRFPNARRARCYTGVPKTTDFFSRFFTPNGESKDDIRRPASRTLDKLADIREYQNDREDSRFYMMKRKSGRFRTHKGFSEISFDK